MTKQLRAGQISSGLGHLFDHLKARRDEQPVTWERYRQACCDHPIRDILHQDPLTYRAFSKPRGYAGDAVMMDYIYGLGSAQQAVRQATPMGRAIFRHMNTRPSALAVRHRRTLIASLIDRVAQNGGTSVLAIASGHLREVELSRAVRSGSIRQFVAIDHDPASLSVASHDYGQYGVEAVNGSVRQILSGEIRPRQFDFVYAAGIFDYLYGPVAVALIRRMLEMALPRGIVLIPNFLPDVADAGYMEAFMDWRLIYRTRLDMQDLAGALPQDQVAHCEIFDDQMNAITYLMARKAG